MAAAARRKKTARFQEIAAQAGVSATTVDRVLNERGSVSQATREKVVAAARQLGVPRQLPDTRHGLIHLGVLLPPNTTPFFRRLNYALQRSIQMLDKRVVVHRTYLPEDKLDAIAQTILEPPYKRQGLILTAPDTARVRDALRTAVARGESVVSMVTNIAGVDQLRYAGIDNYRAGRTAGHYLGRLARRPGRILVLCSRSDYRAHIDRAAGCRAVLGESFPEVSCYSRNIETLDDPDRCYIAIAEACRRGDILSGIYNTGAGSAGVEAALRKFDLVGKVNWVTHEMSDEHRIYIEQKVLDLAIDQDPDSQVFTALQYLLHACGVLEQLPVAPTTTEFRLYCAENVREVMYLPPPGSVAGGY